MALAVALGAFGAHALKGQMTEAGLEIYRTGTLYHMVHGLAAWACASWTKGKAWERAAWAFLVGCWIFGGTLYGVGLGVRWLGAITPVGGALFIAAWVGLAFAKEETN